MRMMLTILPQLFLMPEESFRRLYNQFKTQGLTGNAMYLQLASIFKVPLDSVSRRINEVC